MSTSFRQRHRDCIVRLPLDDVQAHLACGWRLPENINEIPGGRESDALFLAPPPAIAEPEPAE